MTKLISPAPDGWTEYGWMAWPDHQGRDYGWYKSRPIKSRRTYFAAPGKVIRVEDYAGYNDGYGNRIWVEHAPGFATAYNHYFNGATSKFKVGQMVKAGQYAGSMGNIGKTNGTIHLHFEVWRLINGQWVRVDPDPWFTTDIPGTENPGTENPGTENNEQEIDVKLVKRTGSATTEWSLFHPSLRGPSELERGYIVITDPDIARGLARIWADGFGNEKKEPRDVYVEEQAAARWAYDRGTRASGDAATPQQIAQAVDAALKDEFAAVNANVNKPRTLS